MVALEAQRLKVKLLNVSSNLEMIHEQLSTVTKD
jgi:hypothetical protein